MQIRVTMLYLFCLYAVIWVGCSGESDDASSSPLLPIVFQENAGERVP